MSKALETVGTVAKAIVAFVAPGAVVLTSAVTEGSAGGEAITQGEWVTAACATVITAAGVYLTPNKPTAKQQAAALAAAKNALDRVPGEPDHLAGT